MHLLPETEEARPRSRFSKGSRSREQGGPDSTAGQLLTEVLRRSLLQPVPAFCCGLQGDLMSQLFNQTHFFTFDFYVFCKVNVKIAPAVIRVERFILYYSIQTKVLISKEEPTMHLHTLWYRVRVSVRDQQGSFSRS